VTTSVTMRDAKRLYDWGNDHGLGYPPYVDNVSDDTIASAVLAAQTDGWTIILDRYTSDQIAVLKNGDGELLGIGGDGMGRAWAVVLSDCVDALAAWDAEDEMRDEVRQ
jgi:hypothetical protein